MLYQVKEIIKMDKNEIKNRTSGVYQSAPLKTPITKRFEPKENALQVIRDFKVNMLTMSNTISSEKQRSNILAVFNNHIVKLENAIYSFEEEDK